MSARIDHSNYEAWLLDRLEGRLSPSEEQALTAFLVAHPHLDPDGDELPSITISGPALDEASKALLRRGLPPTGALTVASLDDFLIAHREGDLSAQQEIELQHFIARHPEHERAARLVAASRLEPTPLKFADKEALHRTLPPGGMPTLRNLDDFLVAHVEGDLGAEQKRALQHLLAESEAARRSMRLMEATRTHAVAVHYPDKQGLKKEPKVIAIGAGWWLTRLAAAAAIATLLGLGWVWLRDSEGPAKTPIASTPKIQPAAPSARTEITPDKRSAQEASQPMLATEVTRPSPTARSSRPLHQQHGTGSQGPPNAPKVEQQPNEPVLAQQSQGPDEIAPDKNRSGNPPQTPAVALANSSIEIKNQPSPDAMSMGQALASMVRARVLEQPAEAARPLDGEDAVAAVDKGLRALGGHATGLSVARDGKGRGRSFELRLGRNLAISASK